ncbi:MAG: 30S ribosome-binding factor RbfA [Candidatus Ratteibacteria bacterium]|nr:30S ribosome-binding factor RbfA [Candidatus Ratteibacteria bacterium]
MGTRRADRISEAIRREISTMLQQKEIKDPRIGFVTIVAVDVSSDLKEVEVYLTHYGSQADKEKSLAGLKSAAGFIEGEICRRLKLRLVPNIKFSYDEKLEKTMNVLKILDSLHEDKK